MSAHVLLNLFNILGKSDNFDIFTQRYNGRLYVTLRNL